MLRERQRSDAAHRRAAASAARIAPIWVLWATGVLLALVVAVLAGVAPATPACCVAALVPAAVVDLRSGRLPDRLVLAGAVVLIAGSTLDAFFGGGVALTGGVAGALVFGGPLLVIHLASPRSMGFGDVKLALVIGTAVGLAQWQLALPALALAAGLSATVALLVGARTIPFGPGLVSGATIALVAASVFVPPTGGRGSAHRPPVSAVAAERMTT